jgi:hypothetical protein
MSKGTFFTTKTKNNTQIVPPPPPPKLTFRISAKDSVPTPDASTISLRRFLSLASSFLLSRSRKPAPKSPSVPFSLPSMVAYSLISAPITSATADASPPPAALAAPLPLPVLLPPPPPPPPALPLSISERSLSMARLSRSSSSAMRVVPMTSRPWPRAKWRSTNALSTTSCDEAAGMAPVIIIRRLVMSTMFFAPATLSVGAYAT